MHGLILRGQCVGLEIPGPPPPPGGLRSAMLGMEAGEGTFQLRSSPAMPVQPVHQVSAGGGAGALPCGTAGAACRAPCLCPARALYARTLSEIPSSFEPMPGSEWSLPPSICKSRSSIELLATARAQSISTRCPLTGVCCGSREVDLLGRLSPVRAVWLIQPSWGGGSVQVPHEI